MIVIFKSMNMQLPSSSPKGGRCMIFNTCNAGEDQVDDERNTSLRGYRETRVSNSNLLPVVLWQPLLLLQPLTSQLVHDV